MDQEIAGPDFVSGRGWVVRAIDPVVEDTLAEKVFPSAEQARSWIAETRTGISPVNPIASDLVNPRQMPPARNPDPALTPHALRNERAAGKFALRPVAQVLTEAGLDPFVEIARVLQDARPAVDRSGNAVLDDEGKPVMVEQVSGFDRAKVLLELAQYMTPKLKSTEVKIDDMRKTPLDVLDARIEALLGRQGIKGGSSFGTENPPESGP